MAITLIEKKLLVPKESAELVDALAGILKEVLTIKIGGSKIEALTNNLPKLFLAVQGIDKLGDEIKSKNRDDLSAYAVKVIQEAIDKGSVGDELDA